ncbi:hypothetical protein [Chryseobacterium scophthalmum]|uniref:Dolichyl-phosphate-mannose-protein mannosyltransferase n=1 Tax=Chryseobacterium scophthalmum TaxID=59733 RepID=A0A1N6H0Y6_9FLAO|nr:hypothetical protein [Chryseobacterium scophthalmum]SIO13471.1 hypothetical protein SAMN05421769_2105 [Chryseobacterium scophthalmum]
MLKTFDEKLSGFLFVVILPFLLFFMSYYGFESSYTHFKTSERPPDFLFSSVYSYRIIPNYLSIYMTDFIEYCINNLLPFKNLLIKNGTPFYHGLFLMNTFFFILCSGIINAVLKFKSVDLFSNVMGRRIVHLLMIFFIVMTQYTPSNCDTIALFCYLVGIVLTLKYLHTGKNVFFYMLIILIAVSTLVRETACLNIAFFASVFFNIEEIKRKNFQFIWKVIPLLLSFLIPYLGLRIFLSHEETSFMEGVYVVANFTSPFNLAGLLFSMIALYFMYQLCAGSENRLVLKKYVFFSMPYIVMITLVGLFWEVRLFLPLILTGALVACHDLKKLYN